MIKYYHHINKFFWHVLLAQFALIDTIDMPDNIGPAA